MSTSTASRGRPATESTALVLLAILSLSNLAAVASPAPFFVMIIAVALAIAGAAAIAGIWTHRAWGRWAGMAVALASAVSVAPGIFLGPGALRYALAAVVLIALACTALLLASRGSALAGGRK